MPGIAERGRGRGTGIELQIAGFPPNWIISAIKRRSLLAKGGQRIFFGTAPDLPFKPELERRFLVRTSVFRSILWHWKDDYIQPMQKVRAERNGTVRIARCSTLRTRNIQLGDETMQRSIRSRMVAGRSVRRSRVPHADGIRRRSNSADFFIVNTQPTNASRSIKKHQPGFTWSPGGKYASVLRRQGLEHDLDSRSQIVISPRTSGELLAGGT